MFRTFVVLSLCVAILAKNDRPIIGILSQEVMSIEKYFPDKSYISFISAAYVKHLESAGARVIPVWIGRDENYYRQIVDYSNGILLPGGAAYFNETGKYADAGKMLYKWALKANMNGDYYPLFGTCLGFQLIGDAIMNTVEARIDCRAQDYTIPLNFKPGFNDSKLFGNAPKDVIDILNSQDVTYNNHKFCLTESMFIEHNLLDDWKILSTNVDFDGLEFVSCFESKHYPIFGNQFHPEKNQFEFKSDKAIPHTQEAVKIAQYFANVFVNECRNNIHTFPDKNTEEAALIYNYNPHFIGKLQSSYAQVYLFDEDQNMS